MSTPQPPLRVLTFTSLYPSEARPRHGIFVQTRLRQLIQRHPVDVRVVAPVPWFPWRHPRFGSYAAFARTPAAARGEDGIAVTYPRYLMLPKVGVAVQPQNMARVADAVVDVWVAAGWKPEVVDAHYLYPDGVAAARIAERLRLPLVLTARGTDVNVLARLPGPGRRILLAAERAEKVIAVSDPLAEALAELGVERRKLVVLRNGVDTSLFQPVERADARRQLGWADGPTALGVGNLVPEKGFDDALRALVALPSFRLVLVGEGIERHRLAQLAHTLGVGDRVQFVGNMPQRLLRSVYAAADVLLLTSHREGWPNVVLEAMACGTPVVAFDVGAARTMLDDPRVSRVCETRDAALLARAVRDLLDRAPASADVRRHAERFDWASIVDAQYRLLLATSRP